MAPKSHNLISNCFRKKLKASAIHQQSKWLCLVLAEAFLALATACENTRYILRSNPPALSPLSSHYSYKAEVPAIRKLGKHHSQPAAAFSPSESPQAPQETTHSSDQTTSNEPLHAENLIHLKKNHHSIDKSVAGGDAILGGLAITFLAAVFCFVRRNFCIPLMAKYI